MDQERFVTIEEMEAATASLLENGKKVGADSWQQRVKNQTPHCGFGEAGTCCRICAMAPAVSRRRARAASAAATCTASSAETS